MKAAKTVATLLTLAPILSLIISVGAMLKVHNAMAAEDLPKAQLAASCGLGIGVILSSVLLGIILFAIGFALHGILAHRTAQYSKHTWNLLLLMSIITCLSIPLGAVIGIVAITLLFTLESYKKMRMTTAHHGNAQPN